MDPLENEIAALLEENAILKKALVRIVDDRRVTKVEQVIIAYNALRETK